jgi:hypothetical protein
MMGEDETIPRRQVKLLGSLLRSLTSNRNGCDGGNNYGDGLLEG